MNWKTAIENGYELIHRPTGATINLSGAVVGETGLLVSDGVMRFIPGSEIDVVAEESPATPYPEPDKPELAMRSTSDVARYVYFFGLDKLQGSHLNDANSACLYIKSQTILLCEKLELEVIDDQPDGTSIEYSLVEAGVERPILPVGVTRILDERVFYGMQPRFAMNHNKPIEVKKDGLIVDIGITAAMARKDGIYTVSYTPAIQSSYKPSSRTIDIKAVLRRHDESAKSPAIQSLLLRQWGGNA